MSFLGLLPFVATLGTLTIFSGLACAGNAARHPSNSSTGARRRQTPLRPPPKMIKPWSMR